MDTQEKSQLASGLAASVVSLAVYAGVSWLGATLFGLQFWYVVIGLVAASAFFGIVGMLMGILYWRLWGRRKAVEFIVQILRANNFPPREHGHDNFTSYLARIEEGPYPDAIHRAAKELYAALGAWEDRGVLLGARMHAASELALELYSPRARAPAR